MASNCSATRFRSCSAHWISTAIKGAKRAIRLGLLSLQRREDIVTWPKTAVDIEQNTIKVSPGKTQNYGTPIHLEIVMGQALREVVLECIRSPVVCPYLIHYIPKARAR